MKRSEYMQEEIREETNHTWTVDTGWHEPVRGLPTKELAMQVQNALGEAMTRYADMATTED